MEKFKDKDIRLLYEIATNNLAEEIEERIDETTWQIVSVADRQRLIDHLDNYINDSILQLTKNILGEVRCGIGSRKYEPLRSDLLYDLRHQQLSDFSLEREQKINDEIRRLRKERFERFISVTEAAEPFEVLKIVGRIAKNNSRSSSQISTIPDILKKASRHFSKQSVNDLPR